MRIPFRYSLLLFSGGVSAISSMTHQVNEDIRDREVRVISATGEQLGIMSARDALELAARHPKAVPPVCKIMDYGRFRFEQAKKEKEIRKNQHIVEIKEVRMSPSIDSGDFNVKLRNAKKFLSEGNRVKVAVRFRGREMAHTEIGADLLKRFAEECGDVANLDKKPNLEGRHMIMFLSPKTAKDLAAAAKKAAADAKEAEQANNQ